MGLIAKENPRTLYLDESTHIYTVDGHRIDGLTNTIKEAGLIRGGDKKYMDLGTAVHLATENYDRGTSDESTVDPEIQGYLASWKRFRKDQNYTPTEIEFKIFNPELLVASKVDRIPGPLDLKSGSPEPWHILQVAFQWSTMLRSGVYDLTKPMDVYLEPDGGPPKVKLYKTSEMREAYKVYCSMLHFLRWKRERGIK